MLDLRVSQATQMPWCAGTNTGHSFHYNCSLPTYEMCVQEVIAGNRGFCSPNPYYRGPEGPHPGPNESAIVIDRDLSALAFALTRESLCPRHRDQFYEPRLGDELDRLFVPGDSSTGPIGLMLRSPPREVAPILVRIPRSRACGAAQAILAGGRRGGWVRCGPCAAPRYSGSSQLKPGNWMVPSPPT